MGQLQGLSPRENARDMVNITMPQIVLAGASWRVPGLWHRRAAEMFFKNFRATKNNFTATARFTAQQRQRSPTASPSGNTISRRRVNNDNGNVQENGLRNKQEQRKTTTETTRKTDQETDNNEQEKYDILKRLNHTTFLNGLDKNRPQPLTPGQIQCILK